MQIDVIANPADPEIHDQVDAVARGLRVGFAVVVEVKDIHPALAPQLVKAIPTGKGVGPRAAIKHVPVIAAMQIVFALSAEKLIIRRAAKHQVGKEVANQRIRTGIGISTDVVKVARFVDDADVGVDRREALTQTGGRREVIKIEAMALQELGIG